MQVVNVLIFINLYNYSILFIFLKINIVINTYIHVALYLLPSADGIK
jgi:hypothetical protein